MKTRKEEVFGDALTELGSLHGKLTKLLDGLTDETLETAVVDHLKSQFLQNEAAMIDHIGVIELALQNIQAAIDKWVASASASETDKDHRP